MPFGFGERDSFFQRNSNITNRTPDLPRRTNPPPTTPTGGALSFTISDDLLRRAGLLGGSNPLDRLKDILTRLSGVSGLQGFFPNGGTFGLQQLQNLLGADPSLFLHQNQLPFLNRVANQDPNAQEGHGFGEHGFPTFNIGDFVDQGVLDFINGFIERSGSGLSPETLRDQENRIRTAGLSREQQLKTADQERLASRGIFGDSGQFRESQRDIEDAISEQIFNELAELDLVNQQFAHSSEEQALNAALGLGQFSLAATLGLAEASRLQQELELQRFLQEIFLNLNLPAPLSTGGTLINGGTTPRLPLGGGSGSSTDRPFDPFSF
jgi:hypothetical protein